MENVFDPLELCDGAAGADFPAEGVSGVRRFVSEDGSSLVFVGVAASEEGTGDGVGLLFPIFNVIVGAGGGASVFSGRSIGASGGVGCAGTLNFGTNSEAEKLSLLMLGEGPPQRPSRRWRW